MGAKKGKRFFKKSKVEVGNKSVNLREKETPQNVHTAAKGKVKTVVAKEEEKKARRYFPSIPRSITEKPHKDAPAIAMQPQKTVQLEKVPAAKKPFSWRKNIAIFFVVIGIFGNIVLGTLFFQTAFSYVTLVFKRAELTHQMHLWENIAEKYPNYRDAYVQGEILAYEVGNTSKEVYFVQQLKLLDPNYPWINLFEQLQKAQ